MSPSEAIQPAPSDEELAAIVAAVQVAAPELDEPRVVAPAERQRRSPWRFSGRWWPRRKARRQRGAW